MTGTTKPFESVLLVDDETDIRDVVAISLMDMGYTVLQAENAEKAFSIFKEANPPVVLTDIKMPGMSGIELLRKIKHENPETEVIMITGHGDMNLAVKSLKYEATDFITKPINVGALEIALGRASEKIFMRKKLSEYTRSLEQLIREKAELQSNLQSLGLMIGSISHNIKGLLTGLDGGIYMVESGLKKEDKKRLNAGWNTVKTMVERIRKMTLDILYYTKERELKLEKTNVIDFAREVTDVIARKAEEKGISFIQNIDPGIGTFEIDVGYARSALVNILENAIDACMKNENDPPPEIRLEVKKKKNDIIFIVKDNGIGMDGAEKEKIFSLFYSSKGGKGTGLGLFISNRIIRQHDGDIKVASEPGKGSTFTIRLPTGRSI